MTFEARRLRGTFDPSDRIIILGGSGWFGKTLLSMLPKEIPVIATASSHRDGFFRWNERDIRQFQPTVAVNFAFLTRDKIASMGPQEFEATNLELTGQFLRTIDQPSVTRAITVSSGAAVKDPNSLYGRLKLHEEAAALERADDHRVVTVARAFSVSGPYVSNPERYALSNMILGAATGHITVTANVPTYRRYVSVRDLLQVALAWGRTGVIESGGPLVEMEELAKEVADVVNPSARIFRSPLISEVPAEYASDNESWQSACSQLMFTEAPLDQQIREASEWLLSKGS